MSALQWSALVAGLLSSGCLGIAVGCVVNHDRKGVGQLALGMAGLLAFAALVFVAIASQV